MSTTGEIPQSTALAEATVDSLSELFSRDPEGYTRQDRDRIILAMREQRVKWESAEAQAASKPRGQKAQVATVLQQASKSADEMGL